MYSVIASDGQTYGPVDVATLKTWCSEGRVVRDTNLIENETGRTIRAIDLPELAELLGPPKMSPPPPAAEPMGGGFGNANPYAQAPSPYYRPNMAGNVSQQELTGFNWGAFFFTWIWGLNHRQPILLLGLLGYIPRIGWLIHLGIGIWAGVNG